MNISYAQAHAVEICKTNNIYVVPEMVVHPTCGESYGSDRFDYRTTANTTKFTNTGRAWKKLTLKNLTFNGSQNGSNGTVTDAGTQVRINELGIIYPGGNPAVYDISSLDVVSLTISATGHGHDNEGSVWVSYGAICDAVFE